MLIVSAGIVNNYLLIVFNYCLEQQNIIELLDAASKGNDKVRV